MVRHHSITWLFIVFHSLYCVLNTCVRHTWFGCGSSSYSYSPQYAAAFNVSPVRCSEKRETRPSEQTCHTEHAMKVNGKCAASRRDTPVPLWSSRGSREVRLDPPPERPAIWRNGEKQRVGSSSRVSLSPSAKCQKKKHTNLSRQLCLPASLRCRFLVRVLH